MTISDRAKSDDREAELRRALDRALRDLDRAKASRLDLVEATYRAAFDAAQLVSLAPVKAPREQPKGDVTAILIIGDWQFGKVTPEYD